MGMTEMSWNSRTEKTDCPTGVFSVPFSSMVCSTIAVEESARMRPMARLSRQPLLITSDAAPTTSAVPATCKEAKAEYLLAQLPELRWFQFKAHEKEHHDDAELGEVLHRLAFIPHQSQH
jgi:hypothetical protein